MTKDKDERTVTAFEREMTNKLRAGFPVLWVSTYEEERAEREIKAAASHEKLKRAVWVWSLTRGWVEQTGRPENAGAKKLPAADAKAALDMLVPDQKGETKLPEEAVYVLRDFHFYLKAPIILRLFRDLTSVMKARGQTIIVLSPVIEIPAELEKDITIVTYELPSRDDLALVLDTIVDSVGGAKNAKVENRSALLDAARGLTMNEAESTLAYAVVTHDALGAAAVQTIQREKATIVKKTGIMEFFDTDVTMNDVGGLKTVKTWVRKRRRLLTDEALTYGFDRQTLRILLVGVPGVGKSLAAKAIAHELNVPLLRFDVGRVFGSLVGDSERNIRHCLLTAEACSPDLMWFDELEKGFAGMLSGASSDGGVGARVLGTILTWWQESVSPVSIVATCNDTESLPGALLRRFDILFFADLPRQTARGEIFDIHLRKRKRDPKKFDIGKLAMRADQFSGAEIEKAVLAGMVDAFDEDKEVTTEHILHAIEHSPPLAQVQPDAITKVREWAKTHRALDADELVLSEPRSSRRVAT